MSTLIFYAVPAFLALLILESVLTARRRMRAYEARDTAASLAMGIGNVAISLVTKGAALGLFTWLHQYALFDIGVSWWAFALVILGDDFCYYWFHRIHHEVRFFWAAHVNHHSSRHYNLSTALRQSWTTPFTAPIFWAPLALLGFEPWMILVAQSVSLIYQFWIHTELIDRLGPLEWLFNTPSHHRVHHGRNVRYLDRNHGGILILWDRLFGTFEPETEAVDYGLTKNLDTFNPVRIAFHEWAAMLRAAVRARSRREALAYLVRPPGWSSDGRTLTSHQLQQAAGARAGSLG